MSDNEFEVEENFDDDELDDEEEEEEEEEEIEEDDGTVGDQLEVEDDEENIPINEYKTKFSNELRSEYIKTYHPEEIHKPFDEIYQLSHVTRNEEGNIIDHNHKTNVVRGRLCNHCNRGLGHFLDKEDLLKSAINYLVKTKDFDGSQHHNIRHYR